MFHFVLTIHLTLCVFLVVLVLIQQGKGADAGAAFGGGSNTVFGATGATNLMVRITTATVVLFMITSIFLIRGYSDGLEAGPVNIEIKETGLTPAVKVDSSVSKDGTVKLGDNAVEATVVDSTVTEVTKEEAATESSAQIPAAPVAK